MGDVEETTKEFYQKNFKGKKYHEEGIAKFHANEHKYEFCLSFIRDVIQSKKFKGTKLLEIGSATTVHSVASASAYYTNIVQSEFVENSREALKRWYRGELNLDFSPFLNIVAKLEGYENDLEKGRAILESRIRKAVKCVVSCDICSDEVLKMEELSASETQPPYDLIITIWTLEAACLDSHHFLAALQRINKLLRKGGGLVAAGFENGENWKVGDESFPYLHHNVHDVVWALKEAGFGNITFKICYPNEPEDYYKYEGIYCFVAEKL